MLPDDRNLLAYERQDLLLREAAADRLARLMPRVPRPSLRERAAGALIALAMRIAPSVRNPSHGSFTLHG
jgi:hypothetical protein